MFYLVSNFDSKLADKVESRISLQIGQGFLRLEKLPKEPQFGSARKMRALE